VRIGVENEPSARTMVMKTISSLPSFVLVFAFALAVSTDVSAQERTLPTSSDITVPALPNPGLKPGDFFYFLDVWGESIQEFFTFNPENRALLQARFALERIAEVNALLEERGIDAPGLSTAQEKIRRNMERANEILERQRARGREISALAKRLEAEFDTRQDLLESILDSREVRIDAEIEARKAEIEEARLANNFQRITELRTKIEELRLRKERLEALRERFAATLDAEEERMELKMDEREREIDASEDEARRRFNEERKELRRALKERERTLEERERALEIRLREAVIAQDATLIAQIERELEDVKGKEEALREEREALRDKLREARERIQEERQDEEREEEIREVDFETIEGGGGRAVSRYLERGGYVIKTEEAWTSLKNRAGLTREWWQAPTIDFNQHMVIAVFQGQKSSGGFSITVTDVVEYEDRLKVFVTETSPGPDDFVTQALTQPAHIIKLERIEKEVVFDVREENGRPERVPRLPRLERPTDRPDVVPPRERMRERISCRTDFDCLGLICPMVVGGDTPQCNKETGRCFCGPERDAEY